MAAPLTQYSRLVFWLKIVLPILALAILSTLFLFARRIEFVGALPYAEVDIDTLANDPRLTAPEFSGVTSDGAAVKVAAETARPGREPGDPVTAEEVIVIYEGRDGARITLRARSGAFDRAGSLLTLTGDVVLTTSDGYQLSSDRMESSLAATEITAEGAVRADTPFGQVESGAMRVSGRAEDHRLVFNQGVRLVYRPDTEEP